jgi:pyrimidine-nucleoside phosphorylase
MPDILRIIEDRRDARVQPPEDLEFLAQGAAKNTIPDYQLAAWLMAAYLKPLTEKETTDLTLAMARTGDRIDLEGLPKPWVDKHSTGGVGDKTSLVVLPVLAACGLTVVKMSGRGLGITGGTVDKLESIPGFRMNLSPEEMKAQAAKIGIAITGQSPNLAPADKTLYALRDATATTENIPLIASSILSKKIAGGCEYLSLDVKCGSGGFMKDFETAKELAKWLKNIGEQCGLKVHYAITDMDQPLGACVGNALEVREAEFILDRDIGSALQGLPSQRFRELCIELAAETLVFVGDASSIQEGTARVNEVLDSGKAYKKFEEWCVAQGAKPKWIIGIVNSTEDVFQLHVAAQNDGYLMEQDAGVIGEAVVELGGGRRTKDDKINPLVGVWLDKVVGDQVKKDEKLLTIYAASELDAKRAEEAILAGIKISPTPVASRPVILETSS